MKIFHSVVINTKSHLKHAYVIPNTLFADNMARVFPWHFDIINFFEFPRFLSTVCINHLHNFRLAHLSRSNLSNGAGLRLFQCVCIGELWMGGEAKIG